MADEDNIQISIVKDKDDGGRKSAANKTDYVYSNPMSDEYVDVGDVYTNVPSEQIASRYKIQLEDLQHVISERRKNNGAGFKDEYEVIVKLTQQLNECTCCICARYTHYCIFAHTFGLTPQHACAFPKTGPPGFPTSYLLIFSCSMS